MTDTKNGKLDTKDDGSKPSSANSSKGDKSESGKGKKTKTKKTTKGSSSTTKKSSTASGAGKKTSNGHVAGKDKAHASPKPSPKPGASPENTTLDKQASSEELKGKENGAIPAGLIPTVTVEDDENDEAAAAAALASKPAPDIPEQNGDLSDPLVPEEDNSAEEEAIRKELASRIERVQKGSLENLPPLPSRIVRIFTSSTFTDTALERNMLMEEIYPKIKLYCKEKHGLEFQVVDMRWGVRDEATDDHMTTELCMSEIDNCRRLSMGPNFVTFLGQKYGYRPVPTIIASAEFDILFKYMEAFSEEEAGLVAKWFTRDDNAVPAVYILQPISSILVNFNNKRVQKLMEADQNTWWETLGKLQIIFRKAADKAHTEKKMTAAQKHNFFMAVTEREVRRAIVDVEDGANTKDHCLAYFRDITNINLTTLRYCRNYIDMIGRNVDQEAQTLLKDLRDTQVPKKLQEANITRYTIPWLGKEGLDLESHADYLKTFTTHFHDSILDQVDRAVEENRKVTGDHHYLEILSHLQLANNACKVFQGREEMMNMMEKYIIGDSKEPMILYGTPGCGKTSILAKAYSMVPSWLQSKMKKDSVVAFKTTPVMSLRFLGTSPDSSTIVPMLTSICRQICHNYEKPVENMPTELSPLVQYFKKLLMVATERKPLIIFLDSLDQLSPADGAHSLAWFPIFLPPNVKVVVSTLPDYCGIMDTLKKMILKEENYIEIQPLGPELAGIVLKSWLAKNNRTVTEGQWQIVQEALDKCNLPLYAKLVYDDIMRWKSYTPPEQTTLAHTIHDMIIKLFKRVENKHGKILVMHALSYLTASKSGLSEAELEDLLSCDEIVLNDVYQYHLPPVRRIPPLLWTRIRNDMPGYLSEREADGVNVINWYHRQFIEASKERYFRNQNFVMEHHSQIADYFIGKWGGGNPKPFEYSDLQRQRFFLADSTGQSDRKCPEQPLFWGEAGAKLTRYNLRKLSELPYHLIRSKRWEDLYKICLFNFKWLHSKLKSMPLQTIIADFEDAYDHLADKEVKLVADALRLSASVISKHPDMLGPQIVGRLLPYYHSLEKIQYLIQHCDEDGLAVNALDPSYHCLHTPGGPLQYSLEGHPFAPFGLGITSDAKYLVSVSNMIIIWDMSTGDVFRQITPGVQGIMQNLCISPDDKYCISYTNNDQIIICNIMTGDVKLLEKPVEGVETIAGTSANQSHLAVWTNKKWYLYSLQGELLDQGSEEKMNLAIIHVDLSENKDDDTSEQSGGNSEGIFAPDSSSDKMQENNECGDGKVNLISEGGSGDLASAASMHDELSVEEPTYTEGRNDIAENSSTSDKEEEENKIDSGPEESNYVDPDTVDLVFVKLGEDIESESSILSKKVDGIYRYLVWRTQKPIPGVETDEDMILQIINDDTEDFYFHSAIAISEDRQTLYACIAISDEAVACYKKEGSAWKYDRTLGDNFDTIFTLTLSPDEQYLVGTIALGYKLWDLSNDKRLELRLPPGLRNIPNKNPLVSGIVFTRQSQYVVAGVRNNIYVWEVKTGELIKTLDAHFGRIIGMKSVTQRGANKIVSASIDKSIKIWNFDNILEEVFPVERHEKPIDGLSLAAHAYIGATTTRNCVGIWNLESGKLEKTLQNSAHSSIVTHSAITPDARYVVASESGNLLMWDVDKAKVMFQETQKDIMQLFLSDEGSKCVAISKLVSTKARCICRSIPSGEVAFQFDYNMNNFKGAVITCDGLFLVVPSSGVKQKHDYDVLSLYHAKTGTHMYDMNPTKIPNYKDFNFIIAMPSDPTQIAMIDDEKGNIWDVKRKNLVRSVMKWNGVCTHNGKYGLYAPNRGGLEMIELKTGKVHHTLIPKIAEGVFEVSCAVTRNDQHVLYYHSGHRSIRVFRVSDGKQIADYRCPADIKAFAGTQGGSSVVLGAVDGSITVLTIADPKNKHNKSFLASLPSRNAELHAQTAHATSSTAPTQGKLKNASPNGKLQTVVQVARIAAKAKLASENKSRACVVS